MTPYQRLQPFFDAYNSKITDARNEHHMSLNDLSEAAGVSYSAIATQSAGTASNPKLFEQAAIADLFGLSLDELCGLREPRDVSELTERIHQLELENVRQAGDIRRLEELGAEKDKRFSSYRPTGTKKYYQWWATLLQPAEAKKEPSGITRSVLFFSILWCLRVQPI